MKNENKKLTKCKKCGGKELWCDIIGRSYYEITEQGLKHLCEEKAQEDGPLFCSNCNTEYRGDEFN